jgi:hypothetical protein
MHTLNHLAKPFVRAWMVSRTPAEVSRRMAGSMTVDQVWAFTEHLLREGVELPPLPGAEARRGFTLTGHPELGGVFVDQFGRLFTRVGPQATFRLGNYPEEGPWECRRCKGLCSGGWVRFTDRSERRFSCNRCTRASS